MTVLEGRQLSNCSFITTYCLFIYQCVLCCLFLASRPCTLIASTLSFTKFLCRHIPFQCLLFVTVSIWEAERESVCVFVFASFHSLVHCPHVHSGPGQGSWHGELEVKTKPATWTRTQRMEPSCSFPGSWSRAELRLQHKPSSTACSHPNPHLKLIDHTFSFLLHYCPRRFSVWCWTGGREQADHGLVIDTRRKRSVFYHIEFLGCLLKSYQTEGFIFW